MIASLASLGSVLAGCGSGSGSILESGTVCAETGGKTSALIGGIHSASYLELDATEENAIVAIRVSGAVPPIHCSGVLVGPRWVLTAQHCVEGIKAQDITVLFGPSTICPSSRPGVESIAVDPLDDAALLELAADGPVSSRALALVSEVERQATVGQLAQIGGFGVDASGALGSRSFLVEPISAIDPDDVRVDGGDVSGACSGDSGGPLLIRTSDGAPRVLGILRGGSSRCRGTDLFVRADRLLDWAAAAGELSPSSEDRLCGGIVPAGDCFGGTAVRCVWGAVQAEDCTAQGKTCAWLDSEGAYGCVANPSGSCGAVTQIGLCDGTTAVACTAGVLNQTVCESGCTRSPASGRATCASEGTP